MPDTEAGEKPGFKPAPRTILRGPVIVYYSKYGKYPKFHLQRECMDKTRSELVEKRIYEDAFALADDESGRPCRVCALERVLYTVLRPKRGAERVFVTFTSQGCPSDPDTNVLRYRWRDSTESGRDRLKRVAKRFRLSTAEAPAGTVAYGFVDRYAAEVIARNLRAVVRPDVDTVPDRPVIECAWALLDDNPPELRALGIDDDRPDPWEMAKLLIS